MIIEIAAYLEFLTYLLNRKEIPVIVSSRMARHSFVTLMLSKGISVESVAKMLGHTELKITMIYAKILEEKIIWEVNRVGDLWMDLTDTLKKQLAK